MVFAQREPSMPAHAYSIMGRVFATVYNQKHVWASVIGQVFLRVRLRCDDVIVLTKREPKFVIGYRLVSRWRIVQSIEQGQGLALCTK